MADKGDTEGDEDWKAQIAALELEIRELKASNEHQAQQIEEGKGRELLLAQEIAEVKAREKAEIEEGKAREQQLAKKIAEGKAREKTQLKKIFSQFRKLGVMKDQLVEHTMEFVQWKETVLVVQKRDIFNKFKTAVHECFQPFLTKDVEAFANCPATDQHLLMPVKCWNSTIILDKLQQHFKLGHFKSFLNSIHGEGELFIKNCFLAWLALAGANILAHTNPNSVTGQPFSAAELRRTNISYATEFTSNVFDKLEVYIEKVSPRLVPPPI